MKASSSGTKSLLRFCFSLSAFSLPASSLLAAEKVIDTLNVPAGAIADVFSAIDIETTARTNPATDPFKIVIHPGGDSIFWARTRITLRDGFKATGGSTTMLNPQGLQITVQTGFWAAIDSDLNGYSDMEEVTDTDGDGMFDAWEFMHGLNMLVADGHLDTDGDGMTNLQEFLNGRDPTNNADGPTMPSGFQLVLKTPVAFYGVNTTSWSISTVANP